MERKDKERKPKCFNCKHGGKQFKISGNTHLHCQHPKYEKKAESGELSAWETLMDFWNTCNGHEFKAKQIFESINQGEQPNNK